MFRSPLFTAAVGFLGGCAVVLLALVAEIAARQLPLRGALVSLQQGSVLVWVVETLPVLLAITGYALAKRAHAPLRMVPWAMVGPPVAVNTLLSQSQSHGNVTPPPVPVGLREKTSLDPGNVALAEVSPADSRVKALQELVKVLKEQVERTASESREKSGYLANMSHDLRVPIASIVGYTEMLQEDAESRGLGLADDLKKVSGAARTLVELINNVIDISKIEVGQLQVVLEDVDMAQIVDEVRVIAGPHAEASKNVFTARVAPGGRLVRADHGRLRQVIGHLLANAFKFTTNGNVQLVIERATPRRDAWIAIRVKDSGVGMTRKELERAFDEYAQATAVNREDGVGQGLGLAISRKLAELMGGRIEVESEKGVGSTFSVILPPAKISEDTLAPRSTVPLNERLTGVPLLIVDADPFGVALQRYLKRAGIDIELVADAESAKIAGNTKDFAIAIVDVSLPGSWTLLEDLMVDGIKVVAVSLRDEDVEQALQLGVTAFLLRPLDRKLVLATLERCVMTTFVGR